MQYVKRRKKEKKATLFGDEQKVKVPTITNREYERIVDFLLNDESSHTLALPVQISYHTGMRPERFAVLHGKMWILKINVSMSNVPCTTIPTQNVRSSKLQKTENPV